jgi:DNA (cytosine-5)-methyltransferase 1
MKHLTYIDLFAGIGGFHVALDRLGHRCVFASEIDKDLRRLYRLNFGLEAHGDIRKVRVEDVPSHDVLCAGFPCQPFSKAGEQAGLDCPKDGDLFRYIKKILAVHQPRYFILENVPNLYKHDGGQTYRKMRRSLERLGYSVAERILSPHQFGIPQIRERLYIVGSRSSVQMQAFSWPQPSGAPVSIMSVLDEKPKDAKRITSRTARCLAVWQRFLSAFPQDEEIPAPIWTNEFGATYPYDGTPPAKLGRKLASYRGSHGARLAKLSPTERLAALPSYARTSAAFPKWKQDFIRQNRDLYKKHKKWIDQWLPLIKEFPPSWQKLEWNCRGEKRDIWKYVLQFRASGVRAKRRTTAPSLVASTTTQVPIIAWERRYMTKRECSRLQSLGDLPYLPVNEQAAYSALGNAVNADVVELIARALLPSELRLVTTRGTVDEKSAKAA